MVFSMKMLNVSSTLTSHVKSSPPTSPFVYLHCPMFAEIVLLATVEFTGQNKSAGVPTVSYNKTKNKKNMSIFSLLGLRGEGAANPGSCDVTTIEASHSQSC